MSGAVVGALIGLALGAAGFLALSALARRVDLPETRRVLKISGIVDLILFPVVGAFAGGYFTGD